MDKREERIARLHERARTLKRKKDRRILLVCGGVCAALLFCLAGAAAQIRTSPGYTDGAFTGSSLLSENAGGYVMAAVIAFMLGVAITVIVIRTRKKKNKTASRDGPEKPTPEAQKGDKDRTEDNLK